MSIVDLKLGAVYISKDQNRFRLVGVQRKDQFIFQLFDGDQELRQVMLVDRKDLPVFFDHQQLRVQSIFRPQFSMPEHLS